MIRLDAPKYQFSESIEECISGMVKDHALRDSFEKSKVQLLQLDNRYQSSVKSGQFYEIEAIDSKTDPVVVASLKKSDLIKAYTQYFSFGKKPGRKIYNSLLNAAKDRCPFCGGIGTPRNLDHFLPKDSFPQFSILPYNLVPSCRDCNMDGKGSKFATAPEEQVIQPYLDNDRFFFEQWIKATYLPDNDPNEPGEFAFYAEPPTDWDDTDKLRVTKHFDDFNLAKRYASKAAEELPVKLTQFSMLQAKIPKNEAIDILFIVDIDKPQFANHWKKIMCQALALAFK